MWRVILMFLVAAAGFWFGNAPKKEKNIALNVHPEKEYALTEHKSFVVVVYAYNQALWIKKALSSVFEQDYDHYRVILIDDASTDGTAEEANQFVVDNNQDGKVLLFRNETKLGPVASLYRVIDGCLDREIIIPLNAKDWLSSPISFQRIDRAYQNPDVWMTSAQMLDYPSYEVASFSQISYYAGLFKQIRLDDLFRKGRFETAADAYLVPLQEMAGGRIRKMGEPVAFFNRACPVKVENPSVEFTEYKPLTQFPFSNRQTKADILIFSFDRPMQLYACLESVQRYVSGFENLIVLYRASNEDFAAGYKKVKDDFPIVQFVAQSMEDPKHDFKPHVLKIVFDSPSQYILFGVDDIIMKDFVDLKECMDAMEKTCAYGFYLRFGRHIHHCYQFGQPQALPPSQPLGNHIYAWDIQTGEYDWSFPNSLDMTLFKKERLKGAFTTLKYKTPNSLEFTWAQEYAPEKAVGLYFERSKLVNVPMNIVGKTGNPHMDYLSTDELLAKFNLGLKIDIEPLYKIENASPHIDYIPEYVLR